MTCRLSEYVVSNFIKRENAIYKIGTLDFGSCVRVNVINGARRHEFVQYIAALVPLASSVRCVLLVVGAS